MLFGGRLQKIPCRNGRSGTTLLLEKKSTLTCPNPLATFEIHLVKLGGPSLNESEVTTRLKQLFDRVIKEGRVGAYQEAHVQWPQSCPASIPPDQLLVYVVQGPSDSVVSNHFRSHGSPEGAGFTGWNDSVTASEVYVSGCDGNGAGVANMIFHEAMHNKGHWPDAQLHGTFGGGGLASASVSRTTDLNATNVQRMAGVLAARLPQWTGGCEYFNDPLRGLGTENLLLQNRPGAYAVVDGSAAVRGGSFQPGPCGLA